MGVESRAAPWHAAFMLLRSVMVAACAVLGCTSQSTREVSSTGGAAGVGAAGAGAGGAAGAGVGGMAGSGAGGVGGSPADGGGGSASTCGEVDPNTFKVVFTTFEKYPGDFAKGADPTTAANALCAESAKNALPGRSWHAWISTSTTNAIDGLAGSAGAWRTVTGQLVFSDFNALKLGNFPSSPLGVTADCIIGDSQAWTGTDGDGTATPNHCNNWTTTAFEGTKGASGSGSGWTDSGELAKCDAKLRLYCFEK